MERNTNPDGTFDDVAYRQQQASAERVYAKREREALERRAREEGGVVRGGVIVPRKH